MELVCFLKGYMFNFIIWGGINLFRHSSLNFCSMSLGSLSTTPALVPVEVIHILLVGFLLIIDLTLDQKNVGLMFLSLLNSPRREFHSAFCID